MRRLIFGCGYLGKRVAAKWLAQSDDVFALTRSEVRAVEFTQAGIQPLIGDVTDPATLAQLPPVETVLHAVAYDRSTQVPKRSVTVDGLSHALSAMRDRCRVFLHVSSTSVYGQQAGEVVTETSECVPTDESGHLCREAEQLVVDAGHASSDWRVNVLRLSGIYGPDRLLSRIAAIRDGTPLPGPPDAWLNLIHVDDAVAAIIAAAEFGRPSETYLISDDRPIRRHDYYALLAKLLNAPEPIFDSTSVARHMRGINKRCDNRKLREQLGVVLRYPTIDIGLPQAVK